MQEIRNLYGCEVVVNYQTKILKDAEIHNYIANFANPIILISRTYNSTFVRSLFDGREVVTGTHALLKFHFKLLQELGYTPLLLVGKTNMCGQNIIKAPFIASDMIEGIGPHDNFEEYFNKYSYITESVFNALDWLRYYPFIVYNSSNSANHNPIFGNVISRLGEISFNHSIYYLFDTRGANKDLLKKFLPSNRLNPLIHIFIGALTKLHDLKSQIEPDYLEYQNRIEVLPCPSVDVQVENLATLPAMIQDIAPQVGENEDFKHIYTELWRKTTSEIFDNDPNHEVIFVPSRIVKQKELLYTFQLLLLVHQLSKKRITIIVSGPVDFQKEVNVEYFKTVQKAATEYNLNFNTFKILLLGGILEKYYLSVMNQCTCVFGLFRGEGFGMFIHESARIGIPLVISSDEALVETSQRNCLVLPLYNNEKWHVTEEIALSVVEYLRNKLLQKSHIEKLQLLADTASSDVIKQKLYSVLTNGKH